MTPADEEELRRILAVLDAPTDSFVEMARIGRVDPAKAFRGADLREIDFGDDDLTGFVFTRADLRGADLSHARGVSEATLAGARLDAATRLPAGWRAVFPPRIPLSIWREPVPGLPEDGWPDMVTLPAGVFTMGAPKRERDSEDDERPQRQVTVPRPFAIGRVAVTFAQWDAAMEAGFVPPAGPKPPEDQGWGRGERPVIRVSWDDAQAYCAWLNARLGLRAGAYRLPSEAEWEYACRAGTTTPFSFGATISPAQVNYDGNFTYGKSKKGEYRERTVPVGSLPANVWGLHEMHGNVWEWCEDLFGDYPDHATDSRPLGPANSTLRVLRGGSCGSNPRYCRSAFRFRYSPYGRDNDLGFRLARTLF